jgi:flagella basal body P-ring formation protein FlgA
MSLFIQTETEKKSILSPRLRAQALMLFGISWSVFTFLFNGMAIAVADPVTVQVQGKVQVAGNEIYLKDVAEITAPQAMKEKMGAIRLGLSPKPGKEKKISARRLISMVHAAKVMPEDVQMKVPEWIHIERSFQSIKEEVLQELFDHAVRQVLKDADFKVRRVKVSGTNQFPAGRISLSVSRSAKKELIGAVNLRVQVRVNDENCGRLTLSGWVDRFVPVVCVSRDVKNHTVLDGKDLALKNVNISMLSGAPVTDLAAAAGKQTRMTLRAGTCLRSGMLTVPPLVHKGDQVKIIAGSGKLRVSTMGIAKGPGGRGDQIQVENTVSNKTVVGRVTGEATVEVMF